MESLYRFRDWVSLPAGVLALILTMAIPIKQGINRLIVETIEISLVEMPEPRLPPELPPTALKPLQTKPEQPQAKPEPVQKKREPSRAVPMPNIEVKAPAARTEALGESPISETAPASSASVAPPASPNPTASENVPSLRQKAAEAIGLEEGYIAAIRADVQSRKRYPTGREANLQRPQGMVRVCMELDRKGALKGNIDVERSSHSMILDAEAKKLLRTGGYPPFPDGAFPGESTVRLCVNLEYSLQN